VYADSKQNEQLEGRRKVYDPASCLSSEETTQHSAAKVTRKAAGREGSSCDIRGLAELVATRECKGIRDSQYNGDD